MDCDWDSFLAVLPEWMRQDVDALGKHSLQELRLRLGTPPELVLSSGTWYLSRPAARQDIDFCVNLASQYSPWSVESTGEGYLPLAGGHRMGLCGKTIVKDGQVLGFRPLDSLCIRVARNIPGLAPKNAAELGSILILGAPGWGKTTLLRCVARAVAEKEEVCVVDERQELFPRGFARGRRMDVLSGCPKASGIPMVLRAMGPSYIAVDEITAREDAAALVHSSGCGVKLLATAHAAQKEDLRLRPCYRELLEQGIFQTVLLLTKEKSYRLERMEQWATNG